MYGLNIHGAAQECTMCWAESAFGFPAPTLPQFSISVGLDHHFGCHYLNIVCLYYQNQAFSSTPPLSYLISERPIIITKRRSNQDG